ncbi:MAG TPA: hypothetical protein VGE26_07140 [Sphingobacteriaceae bacterium]
MVKIKEIDKVEPGDFVNHHGTLSIITSIEVNDQTVKMTLENGQTIEEETGTRMEFFRILVKQRFS